MSHATHPALQSLQQHIRHALALSDHALGLSATPDYPLMFGVPLPEQHPFDRGNLSIRFSAMSSQGMRDIELAGVSAADHAGNYRLDLYVPQLALRGQYSIDTIRAPDLKLEHGSSIMERIAADPDFNPFDPQAQIASGNRYTKADVSAQKPAPPATIDHVQNIIDQAAGAAGALAAADRNRWPFLNENDRAQVRRLLFESVEERLQRISLRPQPLWQGACVATVKQVLASVDLERLTQGGWKVRQCSIKLPAFALEIDDAAWSGDTARLLRARLNQLFFIKRMLHEKVQQGLKGALEHCLASLPDDDMAACAMSFLHADQ